MKIVRRYGVLAVGVIAMAIGAWVAATPSESFGWFAYAPLSDTTFYPRFVTPNLTVGVVVFSVGLALAAGWVGFWLGTLSRERQS